MSDGNMCADSFLLAAVVNHPAVLKCPDVLSPSRRGPYTIPGTSSFNANNCRLLAACNRLSK